MPSLFNIAWSKNEYKPKDRKAKLQHELKAIIKRKKQNNG